MARQIVKQPNGLYAQWSSVVDDFVMVDATAEEIIADWIESESKRVRECVEEILADLEAGKKRYMTFKECLKRIREVHGSNTESLRLLRESNPPKADGGEG